MKSRHPSRVVPFLFVMLALIPGMAAAQAQKSQPTLTITEWLRPNVSLRRSPGGPVERWTRTALPPQVDVIKDEDPFYSFKMPRGGEIWYVLQSDVTTTRSQPVIGVVKSGNGGCIMAGGMGAAEGCRR